MSNNEFINGTNASFISTSSDITWDKALVAFVLYAITITTIVGNVLVLVAVKMNKKLQTTFNYYIVNLAITDVAVAITAMSFMATHTFLGYWPFGEVLCAIWIFFDYGMTFVSVFTLLLISVDRFWSVKWSVHYRKYHTKRKCIISIVCVWLFMLVLWVPPWILDRVRYSKPGICFWDPSLNKEFVFIVAILGHHGPYCIMIFCYTQVFLFMHKRAKVSDSIRGSTRPSNQVNASIANDESDVNVSSSIPKRTILQVHPIRAFSPPPSVDRSVDFSNVPITVSYLRVPEPVTSSVNSQSLSVRENRLIRDRKAFVTLTYILIGYAILWLPFHIIFDISIINPGLVPEPVLNMGFWMAYFNSTINPILYNFSSLEFRNSFKRILTRCKC
ncbi:muscarinic acetylcholine receptor M3-like [Mercenaria mercenaria]|uniref:muscarinic acetylcholine receptor M3-like n=1 Tax=Mercenaria mercenaria TaxID=6596 RepID=UPI00234E4910|nr:muscarinic acetylcholine receptor M3-like [Mercenaria mercenaria]